MRESPSEAWERCKPLLQRALDRQSNSRTLDDVAAEIEAGRAWFWPLRESAAVLQSTHEAHLWLAAGSLNELLAHLTEAEDWARRQGLSQITLRGRRGWARALAPHGFRPLVTLVKDL